MTLNWVSSIQKKTLFFPCAVCNDELETIFQAASTYLITDLKG